MEITLGQYDQIQQFLEGELDQQEANDFLQELKTNNDLHAYYEFEMTVRENSQSIRDAREILAFSKAIADPHDAIADPPAANIISFRRLTSLIAASLMIAAGSITFFIVYRHHADTPASLFAAYFKKDAVPPGQYPLLAQALTDYKNNEYGALQRYDLERLPILKGADDQHQQTLELGYYYRGISWLLTGAPQKAISDLQWVIDSATTQDLSTKARWYEALALIKTANIPAAKPFLQSLAANQKAEGYSQQATALLKRLSNSTH
jgi:hypothetical protein